MALRIVLPILLAALPLAAQETTEAIQEPTGELTLAVALEAALRAHPDLAAAAWDLPVADAQILQAGLRPNPELSLEAEGIRLGGGTESASRGWSAGLAPDGTPNWGVEYGRDRSEGSAFGETELTLSISQLIELGGKRAARIATAEGGREVVRWEYEALRYQVIGEVVGAYAQVLATQARVAQADRLVDLALRLAGTVTARVEAGAVSPLEQHRVEAQAEQQRVARSAAEDALGQARLQLAALWGSTDPQFSHAGGSLENLPDLAPLADLLDLAEAQPALQRWAAEIARREAALRLARAEGVPDLTLRLGYRAVHVEDSSARGFSLGADGIGYSRGATRTDDDWQSSLVLEASITLPIFNRNQGNIREAELRVSKAAEERRATEFDLITRITQRYRAAEGARERLASLETEVMPKLHKTFDLTEEGYRRGKFGFLQVLDAERALVDARMATLDTRIEYHHAVADLERLLGEQALTRPTNESEQPPVKEHE